MKLLKTIAVTVCAGLSLAMSGSTARATGFTLGDAANYSIIYQGGGNNQLNINNGPGINGLAVNGNIGIDNTPTNNGHLQLSGPLILNSNVHFAAAYTAGVQDNGPYGGNIVVNGTISGGHANVHADMLYLNSLSSTLGAEAGTSIVLAPGTVNAGTGMLDATGNLVFRVTGVNAPNGVLTINGDGIHNVVFNIAANANIHFNQIVLGGGLTSDNVLFNVFGGNDATLSGGPTLDINSNSSSNPNNTLMGTFLDPNGAISVVNTVINGRVFGGDSVNEQVVSGAEINSTPNFPGNTSVPDGGSTLVLLGFGLGCLGYVATGSKFARHRLPRGTRF